ncbi:MAG TPA: FHA domain-containing protein [Planctomycetaceae bacterium]|nr:FHA domain-containing protein [Planctomycetaceae bacterium]
MVAVLHPTGKGSQIVIDRAVVLVGRGAECDSVIDFSSKISRMHCILVQVDADHYVRDLGSMNGVWLNGQRVKKEAKLNQGDTIAIGDVVYQFHANVQPPPRVAVRSGGRATGLPVKVPVEVREAVVISDDILDAQIVENVEFVDDVEFVEDIEDVEVIEDVIDEVDSIEDVIEVIDDVDVIDDIEIIDDVQTLGNEPKRRPRRPPRLR